MSGFVARQRVPQEAAEKQIRLADNLLHEVVRLRRRLDRVLSLGYEAFAEPDSDSYDIGSYLVIQLAHLVTQELPGEITDRIAVDDQQGLRAVRNVAAHDYMQMRQALLWETLTVHVPRLLQVIEEALKS
ncbi:hypothetical protein G7068_04985 [Leucobacter viscericola]|uniref:DUF86 domain-containing protein n=1 Tax=Leucobacter viscericola TaxID=2714935 RepID=A0A6G7XDU0_9MICO|nr:HepT-like ribonuclease domain-containing protein [Leucobacter viscericola]QIK62636.1 hypothetical protein G7068_04985 [Leucobacter viscericola]